MLHISKAGKLPTSETRFCLCFDAGNLLPRVQVSIYKASIQNHNCDSYYGNPGNPFVRCFEPSRLGHGRPSCNLESRGSAHRPVELAALLSRERKGPATRQFATVGRCNMLFLPQTKRLGVPTAPKRGISSIGATVNAVR